MINKIEQYYKSVIVLVVIIGLGYLMFFGIDKIIKYNQEYNLFKEKVIILEQNNELLRIFISINFPEQVKNFNEKINQQK